MRGTLLSLCSTLILLLLSAMPLSAEQMERTEPGEGLPMALRLTVTHHPAILGKVTELQSLGFETQAARARRFPTLSVQAQSMSDEESQVIGRLQQPLWTGGRINDGIGITEAKQQSGAAAIVQLQRQLIEETAAVYAILQGTRLRLQAAERNVEEHEKLLTMISRRQAGNIASEADARLANSRLIQAISQRELLRGQVIKSRNDLLALTQLPISGDEPVAEEWTALPDKEEIIVEMQKKSAPVVLKEKEVEVVRMEAELRRDDMMPTLYARLDQDFYAANAQGHRRNETRVGLVLEGSMEGLGFAGWNKVNAAKTQIRAAEQNVASARNEARRRAQSLLADLEMLKKLKANSEQLVTATEETLQSFMRQYDAGRKTWVDVLNSQKELSESRQGLEQTNSSLLETGLRLAAMLGGLDRAAGVSP